MNILFWTDGFWPRLGGIETHGFHLVKGMQEKGHQVYVIAQKDLPSWPSEEVYEGIPIHRFDFNAIVTKQTFATIQQIQAHLSWLIREFKPDLVHVNAAIGGSAFAFLWFVKMFRVPVVLTAHAPYLTEGKIPSVIERISSISSGIGCVSKWVFEKIKTHLPMVQDKLRLIYNGLPMPNGAPLPLSFSPPTLLLFGRLSPEKGFRFALLAFALLHKKRGDVQLILAGGGPERLHLENSVKELKLDKHVHFKGVLTPEEVLETFNQATLVIVPSLIESFGLVILEAMQMQRPVIASSVEGVPEVVSHGKTGLLVPPQNPEGLCEAIEYLLDHPDEAIEMGKEGRQRALQFSKKNNVDQFELLYKELVYCG